MNFLKKIILLLLFLFPISNSFGATLTHVQTVIFDEVAVYGARGGWKGFYRAFLGGRACASYLRGHKLR